MRVVLRSDVVGLGKRGDIVSVVDGYGRNYLLPRGMAITASAGIQKQADSMRRARDQRDMRGRQQAEQIAQQLVSAKILIKANAGKEGKLFGSVTPADISTEALSQLGIEIDRRHIHLREPIKSTGSYSVPVKLHAEVEFALNIEVSGE